VNRIKTLLALTGAIGLFALLPASEATADHVPGATYSGTHQQGGSFLLTLTGDRCAAAKKKLKKLKKQLKNADSASAKRKLKKKLGNAKRDMNLECVGNTGEPGVPTGERVESFTIYGPVIGEESVRPGQPCALLGRSVFTVTFDFGPFVRDQGGRHGFSLKIGSDDFPDIDSLEGFGLFSSRPGASVASGQFDLSVVIGQVGGMVDECRATLAWEAERS
jgi:hypothetical protein